MVGKYEQLLKYKGRVVELYVASQSSTAFLTETGTITNLVIGLGENGVFIEIDNKTIINVRYIIKIVVKD